MIDHVLSMAPSKKKRENLFYHGGSTRAEPVARTIEVGWENDYFRETARKSLRLPKNASKKSVLKSALAKFGPHAKTVWYTPDLEYALGYEIFLDDIDDYHCLKDKERTAEEEARYSEAKEAYEEGVKDLERYAMTLAMLKADGAKVFAKDLENGYCFVYPDRTRVEKDRA